MGAEFVAKSKGRPTRFFMILRTLSTDLFVSTDLFGDAIETRCAWRPRVLVGGPWIPIQGEGLSFW